MADRHPSSIVTDRTEIPTKRIRWVGFGVQHVASVVGGVDVVVEVKKSREGRVTD
jgi:hypothetical protein